MAKKPFTKEPAYEETPKFEMAEKKKLGPKAFAAEEKSEGDTRFNTAKSKGKKPQYR